MDFQGVARLHLFRSNQEKNVNFPSTSGIQVHTQDVSLQYPRIL